MDFTGPITCCQFLERSRTIEIFSVRILGIWNVNFKFFVFTSFLHQEPEEFAGRRGSKHRGIVLLLENARLVAYDDAVPVHLLFHVSGETVTVHGQEDAAVIQPVHLDLFERSVHQQEVGVRPALSSLDLVFEAAISEFELKISEEFFYSAYPSCISSTSITLDSVFEA